MLKILISSLFLLAPIGSYAAVLSYNFTNTNMVFSITFDKGFSNIGDLSTEREKVITFETKENIYIKEPDKKNELFERIDFFDIPISNVELISEGSRKYLYFRFENNKLIEPVIRKYEQQNKIEIDFLIPEVVTPEAPSAIPGLGAYLRMFLGLGIIIVIIAASYTVMKYFFRHNIVTDIPGVGRLLGKVNIDIKKQLAFYELGETIYILGITDSGVNLVDKLTDPADITIIKSGFSKRKDFSSYMKIFSKNKISDDLKNSSRTIEEKVSSLKKKKDE